MRNGARPRARRNLYALVTVLIALAVHAPVLSHRLLWDDGTIIERQLPALSLARAFAPPPGINQWTYVYYRPLTTLTLVIDHALYGTEPFGYHLTVWLLHGAATLALFFLALRLLTPAFALLGASLFAVYPLHPECVGWIAGRTDILATLFAVFASLLFSRAAGIPDSRSWRAPSGDDTPAGDDAPGGKDSAPPTGTGNGEEASRSRGRFSLNRAEAMTLPLLGASAFLPAVLSSVCFLAALLSKESAIAFAPVLLACLVVARIPSRLRVRAVACVVAPILVCLGMRATLNSQPPPSNPHAETGSTVTGATPSGETIGESSATAAVDSGSTGTSAPLTPQRRFSQALTTAFWAFAYMPQRLVFPIARSPYIEAPPRGTLPAAASFLLVLLGGWIFVAALRHKRMEITFALLLIGSSFATTAVAASMSPTRTPVADRYFYIPAVGWCLLLAGVLAWLSEGRAKQGASAMEVEREGFAASSGSGDARGGGKTKAGNRTPEASILGTKRSAVTGPDLTMRSHSTTEQLLSRAAAWTFAAGWILVAVFAIMTLIRTPIYASKRSFWSEAVRQDPASGAAAMNLGNALAQDGEMSAAQDAYIRALDLPLADADRALTLTSFGAVLYAEGNWARAEPLLRRAASMPGAGSMEAFNLGALLFQIGLRRIEAGDTAGAGTSFVEAIVHLERAVVLDPFFAKAWLLLGDSYVNTGRLEDARRAWRRVIELDGAQGAFGREASEQLALPAL